MSRICFDKLVQSMSGRFGIGETSSAKNASELSGEIEQGGIVKRVGRKGANNKRRRATEACMNCRRYKAKCNEYRPCDRCVEREDSRCEDFAMVSGRSLSTIHATLAAASQTATQGCEANRMQNKANARSPSTLAAKNQLPMSAVDGGWLSEPAAAISPSACSEEKQVRSVSNEV